MMQLKNLYNRLFLVTSSALAVYAVIELSSGTQPALSWLGLLLAAGAPALYLVFNWRRPPAGRNQFTVATGAACGLGLAVTMAVNWRFGEASGMVHLWAGSCLMAWLVYLRWADK